MTLAKLQNYTANITKDDITWQHSDIIACHGIISMMALEDCYSMSRTECLKADKQLQVL